MLNGFNTSVLSRITWKSVCEEASMSTRSFDVVRWISTRRLQWVIHILHMGYPMDKRRLILKAAEHIYNNRKEGDLLMNSPADYT